ncbi:hypothetical protein HanPSC8_Chr06g0234971 [Helianthus annuus]|nr:hypothetical protein HanPSC8_Chr06g0234971 [Helianthus annuus]
MHILPSPASSFFLLFSFYPHNTKPWKDRDRVRARKKCDGEGACPLPPTGYSAPAYVSDVSTSSLPQIHVATENKNLRERKKGRY